MARNIVWISPSLGYCVDVNEAYEHIEAFQEFSQTNFVCTAIDKNFGGINVVARKRSVLWSSRESYTMKDANVTFDGIPFFLLGKAIFECKQGKLKSLKRKAKSTDNQVSVGKSCPAKISLFEVVKFPKHKIESCDQALKNEMIKTLTADLSVGKALAERRFYLCFPLETDHQNHDDTTDETTTSSATLDESSLNYSDVSDKKTRADPLQVCEDLLEKIKEKTFSCDDVTLAYGSIVLKDTLRRLVTVKEHGVFQSNASNLS